MSNDIDLAAEFADEANYEDTAVLPPLEQLYGEDALPSDFDLEAMLAIATDPETPAPEGDLVPETEDSGFEDADPFAEGPEMDDLHADLGMEPDFHEDPTEDPFIADDPAMDDAAGIEEIDPGV
ncbi:hypothetical protein CKALI_02560 [Corynebacterium kalinowskii]|uniref:Uncharacterized protein n=1 Tax=Corynebacterium kalinowskii TaxID=2675216 RepID=A0A6B8VNN4_9CORY|nr:hypothetical protein [Corynebacterium kalinowskii]QGU01401.1 hypothetical protein CKALI_02560 [Corynebacterium kalinowskii]